MVWTKEGQKIGNENSIITHKLQMMERIKKYNRNPKLCKQCKSPLSYEQRKNTFCSHSCSCIHSNISLGYRRNVCKQCGNRCSRKTFCSPKCRSIFGISDKIRRGINPGIGAIKTYLILTRGYVCERCHSVTWLGNKIPLECHHKDGDNTNNSDDNLELLCPNCHAFTDTYKGKNGKRKT